MKVYLSVRQLQSELKRIDDYKTVYYHTLLRNTNGLTDIEILTRGVFSSCKIRQNSPCKITGNSTGLRRLISLYSAIRQL